jgi:hypothetical protein
MMSRGERNQKSGLLAVGTFVTARRNVTVADHGVVNAPSSSMVTSICRPLPL